MFHEELHEVFKYNPYTGDIERTTRMGNYPAGTKCTARYQSGYGKVTYKGQQMLSHRLAWYLFYREQPPRQIDHINQDKADNRIDNLRAADASTNQMNIGVHTRSKTGIKGIMAIRGSSLYRAEVCLRGIRYQAHSTNLHELKTWITDMRETLHAEFARH